MNFRMPLLGLTILILNAAMVAGCATGADSGRWYGQAADSSAVDETIVILPTTRHVNVVGGRIVRFMVGERSFTWHFLVGGNVTRFDLREVAPAGMLDHAVLAYVAPDPRYITAL